MAEFGAALKRWRTRRRKTQQDVASAVKVSRPTLTQWEAGRHLPSAERARRLDDLLEADQELVRLATAARAGLRPGGAETEFARPVTMTPLLQVFRRVGAGLLERLDRDDAGVARGWHHNLQRDQPRTALSTAYGIKTMLLLEDPPIDLRPLEQTVRELELPTGGWSSRSQNRSRPEATAVVLDALFRLSTDITAEHAMSVLTASLQEESWLRPFVLSSVLETVLRVAPGSELAGQVLARLLDCRIEAGGVLVWPERAAAGGPVQPEPSAAHTARAVAALLLSDEMSARPEVADAVTAATEWLQTGDQLGGVTEELDSDDPLKVGRVSIRHFTSAWVAIALSRHHRPQIDPIRTALDVVWGRYQPAVGLWAWGSDASLPIWMTHDSVLALRTAALAVFPTPYPSATET